MSRLTEAVGQALDMLAAAEKEGLKKPWVLSFTVGKTGVFVEAMDVEMTLADPTASPLLALEAVGTPQEVRDRFLAAWAAIPLLSDHHGRGVSAAYEDALGMGNNEGGAGWSWQSWDEIE
jgi:hypothetical protein